MSKALVWMRRDLRLDDQAALSFATQKFDEVYLVFVFDQNILSKLKDKDDPRVSFLHRRLTFLEEHEDIKMYKLFGDPAKLIPKLASDLSVDCVVTNNDYERYARNRDRSVARDLAGLKIEFKSFKDQVIFESDEVLTGSGDFYRVFTPFKNKWFDQIQENPHVIEEKKVNKSKITYKKVKGYSSELDLSDIGFEANEIDTLWEVDPRKRWKTFQKRMESYHTKRDIPAIEGTSTLSPYLRFGYISVRKLVSFALKQHTEGARVWASEIAWRDFYFGLLAVYPHVEKHAYNPTYENIPWENDKTLFKKWCEGKTGVPIVDAGMRQLNETGWMHNRVRMIVASYLTKTLLIDWRWGERYFARKLMDFDLAANNGGWQWSASTGCDAAPYFRVFNPYRQSERFDPKGEYIKTYVSELRELGSKSIHDPSALRPSLLEKIDFVPDKDYPNPIADYSSNRKKVISWFKKANA